MNETEGTQNTIKAKRLTFEACTFESLRGLYSFVHGLSDVRQASFLGGQPLGKPCDSRRPRTVSRKRRFRLFQNLRHLDVSTFDLDELQGLRQLHILHPGLKELEVSWCAPWNDEIATGIVEFRDLCTHREN